MTWLVPKLDKRIQIGEGSLSANSQGGFDFNFVSSSGPIWAGLRPLSHYEYIRGEQVGVEITHEFTMRRSAVANLGIAYSNGYSTGFDSVADLMPLKSDFFIFLQQGSTYKGRLFRIRRTMDNDERGEYLKVLALELEERGTGYPV